MANVTTNHTSANVQVVTENGHITTERPLIIDAAPIANSPHAVSSGGTKKYVDDTIKNAETKINETVDTVSNLSIRSDKILETAEEAVKVVEEIKEEAENFKTHVVNKDNPHEVTADQIGAVPFRIRTLPEIQQTSGFRSRASVYVDDNGINTQMSLQDIKNMNTKILSVETESDINFAQIDKGDYIYIKSEQET